MHATSVTSPQNFSSEAIDLLTIQFDLTGFPGRPKRCPG